MTRLIVLLIVLFAALPASANAGVVKVAGGVLSYTDPDPNAANSVAIAVGSTTTFTVTETGATGGQRIAMTSDGSCTINRRSATCPIPGTTAIEVRVGPLNDRVRVNSPVSLPAR